MATRFRHPTTRLTRIAILGIACLLVLKLDVVTLKKNINVRDLYSIDITKASSLRNHAIVNNEVNDTNWGAFAESMLTTNIETFLGFMMTSIDDESSTDKDSAIGIHHNYSMDIVDLLDWEEASLEGILEPNATYHSIHQSCTPPPGVSRSCCLGSFSNGGGVTDRDRGKCTEPMQEELKELQEHTQQFFQENALDNDKEPIACDVCRIIELARQDNLTIAFMGDSMHNQVIDGLSCELQRRNYNVSTEIINLNPQNDPTWIFRRHGESNLIRIQSPFWGPDESVTIEFHRMYLLPLINDGVASITASADVLVLGFGLHWWYTDDTPHVFRRKSNYITAMGDLFRNVTEQGHVKLLVHRETSAQHFDSDGGEFSLWHPNREHLSKSCQAMKYNDSSVMWREKAVQRAANESGHSLVTAGPSMPTTPMQERPEVVVLPYFNFTSQHHRMHPHQNDFHDCTHYCSSPYVYYPLWRSLRFAMQRQFVGQQEETTGASWLW